MSKYVAGFGEMCRRILKYWNHRDIHGYPGHPIDAATDCAQRVDSGDQREGLGDLRVDLGDSEDVLGDQIEDLGDQIQLTQGKTLVT